jgi:hypothetical protein
MDDGGPGFGQVIMGVDVPAPLSSRPPARPGLNPLSRGRGQGSPRESLRPAPRHQSKRKRRTLAPVRTVLNPLGFLLAGLAIGYVLVRSLNRLTGRDGRNEIGVDFPPGSEAERKWRLRVSGLEGTSPTAL